MGSQSRRRGPALGGVCLRKTTDFPQTHTRVPIADRQSIHGMPVIAGWIELARRYRTSYQRPPGSNVTSQEMYPSANILAFAVQAHAEPRGGGVTAAFRSKTRRPLALPRPWRTHAPHSTFPVARRPQWPPIPSWFVHSAKGARSPPLASAQACSSDLPSSCAYLERYRNDCRPLWMVFPALNRSKYVSAASVRAASCSYRVRP